MPNQTVRLLAEADIERWLAGGGLFPTAITPVPALLPDPRPCRLERRLLKAQLHAVADQVELAAK